MKPNLGILILSTIFTSTAIGETFYCIGTDSSLEQTRASNGYQFLTVETTISGNTAGLTATRSGDGATLLASGSAEPSVYNVDTKNSSYADTDDSQLYLMPTIIFDGKQIAITYWGPEAVKRKGQRCEPSRNQSEGCPTDRYRDCSQQKPNGWQ
jgi:hypothetical protein